MMTTFFGSFFEQSNSEPEEEADMANVCANQELVQYKMFKNISMKEDPFEWWKVHSGQFPLLTSLAKSLLGIPGTSVASERVFSTAGDIVDASRSCLKWHKVDKMIFLRKNMK